MKSSTPNVLIGSLVGSRKHKPYWIVPSPNPGAYQRGNIDDAMIPLPQISVPDEAP